MLVRIVECLQPTRPWQCLDVEEFLRSRQNVEEKPGCEDVGVHIKGCAGLITCIGEGGGGEKSCQIGGFYKLLVGSHAEGQ